MGNGKGRGDSEDNSRGDSIAGTAGITSILSVANTA